MSLNIDGGGEVNIDDNITSLYSTWSSSKIASSGGATITKTQNIDLVLTDATKTKFNNLVESATGFKITGGLNTQFLLADGTTTTSSGNNNSSNIYLYNSSTVILPPPGVGQIRYNDSIQSQATQIYVSHLTRGGIDIDEFLSLITDELSIIYIQDENNSLNYIKYSVNGAPTILLNDYITIPVLHLSSAGTGSTNYANGHNIFMSIFTNNTAIDTRISNIETKTQNQSAILGSTTFTGKINNLFIKDNSIPTNILISNTTNNTLGVHNTVVGNGIPNCTGSGNSAFGYDSMPSVSTGVWNTSIGFTSGTPITTGSYNCNMGVNTNRFNTTGNNNTAIGVSALQSNTASNNTALGYGAGNAITTFTNTTCIGYLSVADASNQVVLGNPSITEVKSSGVFTSNIGFKTTTGLVTELLTADGGKNSTVLTDITTLNTKTKNQSAIVGTTTFTGGVNADFLNKCKLQTNLTNTNMLLGPQTNIYTTIGENNVGIGNNALVKTSGSNNCAIGGSSQKNNTTASRVISIGNNSLELLTTGTDNIAIGDNSLKNTVINSGNLAIGTDALINCVQNNNIAIGYRSGASVTTLGNTISIGLLATATKENQAVIGNNFTTELKTFGFVESAGYKVPLGSSTQLLKADGNVDITIVTDVTNLNSKTQNQSAILGTTTFTGGLIADSFKTPIGTNVQVLCANGTIDNNLFKMVRKNWDVIPLSIFNNSVTANSWDYYINESAPYDIYISKIRVIFTASGSDNSRFAIYRGNDLSAVLVAQTASLPAASITLPFTTLNFIPETGQNTYFAKDENIVIAYASSGISTRIASINTVVSLGNAWYNTTDSSTGFLLNPRTKAGGLTSIFCCRLIAANITPTDIVIPTPPTNTLTTPHNLTSNTNTSFQLTSQGWASTVWKMFDSGLAAPNYTFSGGNTYSGTTGNALLNSFDPGTGAITGSWLKIDLGTLKSFNRFKICGSDQAAGQNATTYTLYGSNDNTSYSSFYTATNYTYVNFQAYEPTIALPTQEWRYIVFQCTQIGNGAPAGQNGCTIAEMDFSYA